MTDCAKEVSNDELEQLHLNMEQLKTSFLSWVKGDARYKGCGYLFTPQELETVCLWLRRGYNESLIELTSLKEEQNDWPRQTL